MSKYYHLYAMGTCPYCLNAIKLLDDGGYNYTLTLLDKNELFLEHLKTKYNWKTVPIILEHDENNHEESKFIGGYTDLMDYFAEEKPAKIPDTFCEIFGLEDASSTETSQ